MKKRFAVFISGYGRGCIDIINDISSGLINPNLVLVLSSSPDAFALKIAITNKIDTVVVQRKQYRSSEDFEGEILKHLHSYDVDYIFLAGWKYILKDLLLNQYERCVVNIHPSLLPCFPGIYAIDQAINAGVKLTGITTHYVDKTLDGGEIIGQKSIRIEEKDRFIDIDNKIYKAGTILTKETINKVFI